MLLENKIEEESCTRTFFLPEKINSQVGCIVRVPANPSPDSRIIVAVHGISRSPMQQISMFSSYAEKHNAVVVAPFFDKKSWKGYQKLLSTKTKNRADEALMQSLKKIRTLLNLNQNKIFLHGYSGGGQFVHRFAMQHADMVEKIALGAAGWYTMPDNSISFPFGLKTAQDFSFTADQTGSQSFADLKYFVAVGDRDTAIDKSLNQSAEINEVQGKTRLDRAKNWVDSMKSYMDHKKRKGSVELFVLDGVGHSCRQFMLHKTYHNHLDNFFFPNN